MADCKSVSCKCLDASYVNANKFIASRCAHTTDIIDRIRRDLTEANELITQWNATIGDNSELSSYVFNNNFTEEYTNADIGAQFSSAFSDYPAVKIN